jgi:hypothetical protein
MLHSYISDDDLNRKLMDSFDKGYNKAIRDAQDTEHLRRRQYAHDLVALQKQVNVLKSDIVAMERRQDKANDDVVMGMKFTSDRVTTLAQDTTKRCELLQNQIYDLKHPGW